MTILGKKLKTKWVESKVTQQGMTAVSKVWICDEMPGQVVKLESHGEGGMAMSSTGEVVDFSTASKAGGEAKTPAKEEKKADEPAKKDGEAPKKDAQDAKKEKP